MAVIKEVITINCPRDYDMLMTGPQIKARLVTRFSGGSRAEQI